jgi:hypothetical protein
VKFNVKSVKNASEANAVISDSGDVDGYLVYVIGIWTGAVNAFICSGKPVVLVDDLYAGSGEVLLASGAVHREKLPVVMVSSSNFQDVVDAGNLFSVIR